MKYGLKELSDLMEKIVKIDEKTAKRYRVVEETIDLEALRQEKANLEAQLAMIEPSKEELIEYGRSFHPFYMLNREQIQARLDEIKKILG